MKFKLTTSSKIQPNMLGSFGLMLVIISFTTTNLTAQDTLPNPQKEIKSKHVEIVIYEKGDSTDTDKTVKRISVTKLNDSLEIVQKIEKTQSGDGVQESLGSENLANEHQEVKAWKFNIGDDPEEEEKEPKLVEQSWFVMDIGLNTWLTPKGEDLPEFYDALELNTPKSVNFHLGLIQQGLNLYKGKLRLVYGLGIEFNNYRFKKNVDLTPDQKTITFAINSDIRYTKNKLVSQYATIPLMLNFKSNPEDEDESFNVAAGIQMGYLLGSHTKQKWEDGGRKEKSKQKGDYNFTEYRLGYVLQFGYGDFNLIAKYYPTTVFSKNQGPVVNTASVGVVISPF